jgi:DNA-binding MurR/RpiR family transcriptional regulator
VISSEIDALSAIPRQVSQTQIEAAVRLLLGARRIVVFGTSHAGVLATLLARRLIRSGYHAHALQHVDWEAADGLLGIGQGDVLIAFQFWRATKSLTTLAGVVKARGGHVILISDGPARLVEPKPDVVLAALRGGRGESQSLAAPMILANVLVLELSRNDGGRSLRSLDDLGRLRDALDADPRLRSGGRSAAPSDPAIRPDAAPD